MPSDYEASAFEAYYPYVVKLVRQNFSWHNDTDNLIGVGSESLLRAIRRFDSDRGVPFWGFAKTVVLRDIKRQINTEEKLEHNIDDYILTRRNARF